MTCVDCAKKISLLKKIFKQFFINNFNKRKPDSCSALNSPSEMICRIQRGHRSFLLISLFNPMSGIQNAPKCQTSGYSLEIVSLFLFLFLILGISKKFNPRELKVLDFGTP